jgi:imidazolonepropionase-like amidohydrolase
MRTLAIAFVSLFTLEAPAQPSRNQASEQMVITDVTIISPERLDHIDKASVLIENGRITRVERSKRLKKPSGATVVSGQGQFLIPALIDSHVHLAFVPGMTDPDQAKPEMIKEYLKQLPRSYLYFGYTALVDLAVTDRQVLDDFKQAPATPGFI